MRGVQEILVSFGVGLITLTVITKLQTQLDAETRKQPQEAPAQLRGPSEDPALSLTWGINEIRAPEAWQLQAGSRTVTVAVIDTGCDIHHPDLSANIWINPGESGLDDNGNNKATNGQDDDGNGFVDDVHGWNFVSNSPEVMDDHGHGTHIAGIIGAERLNGRGLSGVAPAVSLMVLKYYDSKNTGKDNLKHTIKAIYYAVKMGAQVINYSGGGILRNAEEEEALRWAAAKGVLVVAAAGNEGLNSDFFHFYPAGYDLPNILSVTAIDRQGRLLEGSNFGVNTVDMAAPGRNIYSTLPGGAYGYMSGTSQATAFASGIAALLIAQDERFHQPQVLIQHMMAHGRAIASLKGRTRTGRLVDALAVLQEQEPVPIQQTTGLFE